MCSRGQGVPQSDTEAVNWYRKAAEAGDKDAQYRLGIRCAEGWGTGKDLGEAARWLAKAASQGQSLSQLKLAQMYLAGTGVPVDNVEAYVWASLALSGFREDEAEDEEKEAAAARDRAASRLSKPIVQKAQLRVSEWAPMIDEKRKAVVDALRKKAEAGDAAAQFKFGSALASGNGLRSDRAEAVRWYRKAAEQGYTKAQHELGVYYERGLGIKQDYSEAARWYREAAGRGLAEAQAALGRLYLRGDGVQKSDAEAFRWMQSAAVQGQPDGQGYMGSAYFEGTVAPKDAVAGYMWFTLALAHEGYDYLEAVRSYDAQQARMSAEQIAQAERKAETWQATGEGALFPTLAALHDQQRNAAQSTASGAPANSGQAYIVDGQGKKTCFTSVCDPKCRMVAVACGK
jgi:hypothetical protein